MKSILALFAVVGVLMHVHISLRLSEPAFSTNLMHRSSASNPQVSWNPCSCISLLILRSLMWLSLSELRRRPLYVCPNVCWRSPRVLSEAAATSQSSPRWPPNDGNKRRRIQVTLRKGQVRVLLIAGTILPHCMVVFRAHCLLHYTMQRDRGLYHHYIPQFILRGFAVSKPTRCFADDGNGGFVETKLKPNRRHPTYDRMNVYHLDEARLIMASDHTTSGDFTNTVHRNFGLYGLYVDEAHPNIEHIERSLGELENEAARVVRAAVAALESPEKELRLPRRDLNTLRKFLFIMSYRHNRRGEQFLNNRFDDAMLRDIDHHIKTHLPEGSTARDVWLQNIKEILDTDYWLIPDNPRIFVHDRNEFAANMRMRHIVFWRATAGREFITCNNGFGFVEGVRVDARCSPGEAADMATLMREMGSAVDDASSLRDITGNFDWFRLFPLHPKLSIALVSNYLSIAEAVPWLPASRFHTMPRVPHKTHYAGLSPQAERDRTRGRLKEHMVHEGPRLSAERRTYLDGKLLESRVDDIFVFPLIPLDAEQTHRFNAIFLDNVSNALAFVSPGQLYRSIVHYESSKMWEHKRDYTALKAALRAYSQLTHALDPCFAEVPARVSTRKPAIVANADRRLVWVSSVPNGPEDPPDSRQIVAILRLQHRLSKLPLSRRPPGIPEVTYDDVFGHLNRTHKDSLFRNEESERARRQNASAEQPSPAKPRPRQVPPSQASRVPGSLSTSRGKKPFDQASLLQTKPSPTIAATASAKTGMVPHPRPAPKASTQSASPQPTGGQVTSSSITPAENATETKAKRRKRNKNRQGIQPKAQNTTSIGSSPVSNSAGRPSSPRTPVKPPPTLASCNGSERPVNVHSASSSQIQGPSILSSTTAPGPSPQLPAGGGSSGKKKRTKRK